MIVENSTQEGTTLAADTYYSMPWADLLAFLAAQGFTVLEQGEFPVHGLTHHQVIAANCEHKLLVYANSYNWPEGEVVYTCRLYGVIRRRPDVPFGDFYRVAIASGNYNPLGPRPAEQYQLLDSYRDPLAARIAALLQVAQFVNWSFRLPAYTSPNLLHHGHGTVSSADVDAAFRVFLDRCPPEVHQFITAA